MIDIKQNKLYVNSNCLKYQSLVKDQKYLDSKLNHLKSTYKRIYITINNCTKKYMYFLVPNHQVISILLRLTYLTLALHVSLIYDTL